MNCISSNERRIGYLNLASKEIIYFDKNKKLTQVKF